MRNRKLKLNNKAFYAILALILSFIAISAATFAWYIYNTNAYTTKLHMAAGSSDSLLIKGEFDDDYGYTTSFQEKKEDGVSTEFIGQLVPVSTDCIQNGFQEVSGYEDTAEGKSLAKYFKTAKDTDYYKCSMHIKSGKTLNKVYIEDIGYSDSKQYYPISSSLRVGLLVYKPGSESEVDKEYIFEINPVKTDRREYNTASGQADMGYVLDSTKTDGSTVVFEPKSPKDYYYIFDNYKDKNKISINPNRLQICECPVDSNGNGIPVKIDVYIWMEGCDEDCVGGFGNLASLSIYYKGESE